MSGGQSRLRSGSGDQNMTCPVITAHLKHRTATDLSVLGSNPDGSFFLLYFTLPLKITQALSCYGAQERRTICKF